MFGYAKHFLSPTPKGSVREPGSLTLPQVNPAEGIMALSDREQVRKVPLSTFEHLESSSNPCL
jgi:hypothetical protein